MVGKETPRGLGGQDKPLPRAAGKRYWLTADGQPKHIIELKSGVEEGDRNLLFSVPVTSQIKLCLDLADATRRGYHVDDLTL